MKIKSCPLFVKHCLMDRLITTSKHASALPNFKLSSLRMGTPGHKLYQRTLLSLRIMKVFCRLNYWFPIWELGLPCKVPTSLWGVTKWITGVGKTRHLLHILCWDTMDNLTSSNYYIFIFFSCLIISKKGIKNIFDSKDYELKKRKKRLGTTGMKQVLQKYLLTQNYPRSNLHYLTKHWREKPKSINTVKTQ